jgi:cysteine synthase B
MKNAYLTEIREGGMPIRVMDERMNPFAKLKVVLHAICGFQMPNYVTMKTRMVYEMLEAARAEGKLKGLKCIIEASSGATGLVIPMLARDAYFGIPDVEVVIVMNENVPDGKRLPIKYAGATVIKPVNELTTIGTARKLGGGGWSKDRWEASKDGWLNLDQYANPANPAAYRRYVAPQIIEKMQPHGFGLFVCPIGTGGTVVGLSEAFRRANKGIRIIGAMNVPGETIPGMRSAMQMSEISFPWEAACDRIIEVKELFAWIAALQIQDHTGMMMGISSGASYVATLMALRHYELHRKLDSLRSEADGCVHAMFVAHDGLRTYTANQVPMLDEYLAKNSGEMVWEQFWED